MRERRLATVLSIVVVLTRGGIIAYQGETQRRLDPAIGPAMIEKYKSIRDAQDWLNPYVSVCPQGVILTVRSVKRVRETVPPQLRDVLIDLPVQAWPYGRIIALQDCSLGVPGDSEDRKKRMVEVERILNGLGLELSRWPS